MSSMQAEARSRGSEAVHSRAFEVLARAGFVARGVIYGTIGLLAIQIAIHAGGKSADQRGAMHAIQQQPFGHWLLIAVAIGLGGYSLWRFVQAFFGNGPEGGGDDSKMGRLIAAASGCAYAAMCVLAITILLGTSTSSSSNPHLDHRDRRDRPSRPDGRVRPDRDLPGQGRDRLRTLQGARA